MQFAVFLRDLILKLLQERREIRKSALSIYQKYAEPLAATATSLLWRLYEVFYVKGRGVYLKGQNPRTSFEEYKKISTLYRLGSILGWIRAFRRELSFLRIDNRKKFKRLENAISFFESGLADGPHVEIQRLNALSKLWNFEIPNDDEKKVIIGVAIEQIIKRYLYNAKVSMAKDLSDEDKEKLCKEIVNELCEHLQINSLPQSVILETKARFIHQISIKEAWLYRDWQAGIGDLMIREISSGNRRFEVIGFRQFEKIFTAGDEEEQRWLNRLNNVVNDLDVSGADRFDARIFQLRNTLSATAKLIKALSEVKTERKIVSEETFRIINKIIQDAEH